MNEVVWKSVYVSIGEIEDTLTKLNLRPGCFEILRYGDGNNFKIVYLDLSDKEHEKERAA